MKKRTAFILSAVLLTGCSVSNITGGAPDPKICSAYETDITVETKIAPLSAEEEELIFSFGGHLTRLGNGFWEITLTSPETLSGMEISLSDNIVSSKLDDLGFDSDAEGLPEKSPLLKLFSSLDSAAVSIENGTSLEQGSDGWILTSGDCTIVFNENGCPVSMAMPSITAEFSGFADKSDNESSETTVYPPDEITVTAETTASSE